MSTAQSFRLDRGGRIDRTRPLRFTFDERDYTGFAGDTLASALLANGVRLVGRSFKYHRPRGILSAGVEEPNALIELRRGARREPNTRATGVELYDGLTAASQNRWPSLRFDIGSMNGLLSPFIAAGFYYKTFMWPASFWEKLYEPLIRRAAGLGRAAHAEDPDHYEKAFAFCDVLVIGGGAAGLSAALAAGRAGARVILCDDDAALGGRLLCERRTIGGDDASAWIERTIAELTSLPDVRLMRRTAVFGTYDHGTFGAVERVSDHLDVPPAHQPRQRMWRIVARHAVLATGATERPIIFNDNDRPGIMLAGAVRAYVNRFAVLPGRTAVVFTTGDDGWHSVADLTAAGVTVAAVIDPRSEVDSAHSETARRAGARVFAGGAVVRTHGGTQLSAVSIADASGRVARVACDLLAMSNGWNPNVQLACHLGHKPVWDEAISAFIPAALPPGMKAAGASAGRFSLAQALAEGSRAGAEAASACGFPTKPLLVPETEAERLRTAPVWRPRAAKGKAFVDFQNDVTDVDVELSWREGFRAVEHLKRYTTLGMATDQGKTANVAGLAIMAELTGRPIPEIGTTTFRPPYTGVAIGALAGHHRGKDFRPTRLAPSHGWAVGQGAVFVDAGQWLRAQYFPHAGEGGWLESASREMTAVRSAVGICDVSTLGKIDIQGPDAATLLDRVYANRFSNLAVGKARYGIMLREDGFVFDDGTTSRLGETHFVMTTTTNNAARVMQHLHFCHQVLWPELDLQMISVTEQWAQYAVAGPRSRDTLRGIVDAQHDISNQAFPYLTARAVTIGGGIPARLFRISFSGELGYELAVPAAYGEATARALMEAGAAFGITPYGTEALGALRIEKGHVAGAELNGQTTAHDLGLGRMISAAKDFIGRAMAARPALTNPARRRFVGFKPVDASRRLRAGAHFVGIGKETRSEHDEGYLTSAAYSPHLKSWIGLGMLERGPDRIGERVVATDPLRSESTEVEICHPAFVDPEGERLRV
jgi:sarcosine oxidase subunit alpha